MLRAFKRTSAGARTLDRDMGRVSRGALAGSGVFGGLGRSLAFASGGFLSGAAAVGVVVKAFQELNESRKVTAQTNAVIKSTGAVAGVTAEHVDELGQALLRKTGIDDEAIRSSQNLLLTFTNVRNVIGDGNNVFDQATQAVLDMSTAMDGDLQGAAIRVGKALQDPIRGVTALRRVGVQLTDSQQRQITALVRTGRVMEAQKIILRELTREFGGSAAAAGDVQPWNRLRETIVNLSAVLAEKFLPKIQEATERLQKWLDNPVNTAKIEKGAEDTAGFFGKVVSALDDLNNKGNKAMEGLRRGVDVAGTATRIALLQPLEGRGPIADFARREKEEAEAHLRELLRGVQRFAGDYRAALQESLQLKGRVSQAVTEATGAEPPGRAGSTGLTATQRNTFFDNNISRALRRVQDSDLRGQLRKLAEIAALITARYRITKDITRRLNLEDQLLDIRRQRKSVLEQIADNMRADAEDAKAAAEDAVDAAKEAARKLVEARNARQFFALGLSPTGGERTPNIEGLRRQLGNFEDAVKGTFLDTKKTRSLMATIKGILAKGMKGVSEEVRATIRDMIRDLNQQLGKASQERTKFRGIDTKSFLRGLGLDPDEIRALRGRLSQIGPGGTVPTRGQGAFGIGFAGGGIQPIVINTTVELDREKVGSSVTKVQQRTAARTPAQRGGRNSGQGLGLG